MRAFVTGANGFLGSHLVDRLLERGDEVHVLVRKSSNLQWLLGKDIHYHYGDVFSGNPKGLREGMESSDVVYHLAGVLRSHRPSAYYEVNVRGTVNLLEACLENPSLKRVVIVTSLAAHGPNRQGQVAAEDDECHPMGDYGKSKRDSELVAMKYALRIPISIVRPPAIYGPRDDQVFAFFQMVKRGVAFLPKNGEGVLNMAHVNDVVDGILLAAEHPKAVSETFFIGEDENHSWNKAADVIGHAMERRPFKIHVPGALVYAVCGVAEAMGRLSKRTFPLNLAYADNFLRPNWALSISKARRLLGYAPKFSLERGARETARWYFEEGWL